MVAVSFRDRSGGTPAHPNLSVNRPRSPIYSPEFLPLTMG
jgi:hypothetical protein